MTSVGGGNIGNSGEQKIFFCQQASCRKPLEIDESILQLDSSLLQQISLQELEEKLKEFEANEKENDKPVNGDLEPASYARLAKQFELISDATGIDHPLCKECTQKQLKLLNTQLNEAMKENTSYRTFIKHMESENSEEEHLDEELQKLEEEESNLISELNKIEEERKKLKNQIQLLEEESSQVKEFEEKYWKTFTQFQTELLEFQEEYASVQNQLTNAKEQLEKFKTTDVFNDTFHIWHDGHFGTINNFRLGRLPSQPVDWNEINAAWGQAALLLYTIAKKINFQFSTYQIIPLGSCSKMEKISDKSTYELYGFSDISLGKLFWYRRFDTGMVAFLTCLKEIGDHAEKSDKTFRLPYKIDKDKINDISIKYEFTNEETWTKALKYMLTNLKYIVAWVARQNV